MDEHPDLLADARQILAEADCPYTRIVSIDFDSILYLNAMRRPRTLWLFRNPDTGKLKVRMATGFPAVPPVGWP